MSILTTLRHQATPPSPLAGRLSVQSLLFALGEGTFMTGSAVFFTQIVGLSAAQVGLGLTIAGHRRVPRRRADGQAGRPLRAEEDVGGQRGRPGGDVRGLAVHHRFQGLRRDGRRAWR